MSKPAVRAENSDNSTIYKDKKAAIEKSIMVVLLNIIEVSDSKNIDATKATTI